MSGYTILLLQQFFFYFLSSQVRGITLAKNDQESAWEKVYPFARTNTFFFPKIEARGLLGPAVMLL